LEGKKEYGFLPFHLKKENFIKEVNDYFDPFEKQQNRNYSTVREEKGGWH
jgi:hypothetical protein